jgi:hypothetical protein
MLIETDPSNLLWGEFDSLGVAAGIEGAGNGEAGFGLGLADEANDGCMINERDAGPLLADLGEEPVLDRIPFGCAGGKVADGDKEPEGIGEPLLQGVFPQVGVSAVAAAVVGEDEQAGGLGIAATAVGKPPAADRLGSKARRVTGDPDIDRAAVGLEVVNAVGNGDALAEGAEVVVEDLDGLAAPNLAGVLEVADQFALLGVDADDRRLLLGEAAPLPGDIAELPIALGRRLAEALAVGMEGVAERLEQAAHGIGRNADSQTPQESADLPQAQSGPHSPPAHRIAGRVRFQQGAERVQDFGRFFSTGVRPPPSCRTRSRSTLPSMSSRRPRATVAGSSPSSSAMRRSPP